MWFRLAATELEKITSDNKYLFNEDLMKCLKNSEDKADVICDSKMPSK